MVAAVSGLGLGLFNTSAGTLGGMGPGNASIGRGNDRAYINTATGNLILQSQDEALSALGLDVALVRTYNSQGLMDDDNGDNWRLSAHQRLYNLTGALNVAGSTITKVFGDGHESVYRYDASRSAYVSTEGEGAHDTLTFASNSWVWEEGSSQVQETYDENGRLTSARDADGNEVTYHYTGSFLTRIDDASGQSTHLDYTGNNLTGIRVVSEGVTQTLTTYQYDGDSRLTSVTVDLTPANTGDAEVYVTTYTYEGTSRRIASITQTDGSSIAFTYELVNGQYRVRTYTDAMQRVTTLTYTSSGASSQTANADPDELSTTRTETTTTTHELDDSVVVPGAPVWGTPETTTSGGSDPQPAYVQYDANGNAFELGYTSAAFSVRRYDAATATWSAWEAVIDMPVEFDQLPLAMDDAGNAVLAWVDNAGAVRMRRYSPTTGQWSASEALDATAPSMSLRAVSINNGHVAIAWLSEDETQTVVMAAMSTASGMVVQQISDAATSPYCSLSVDASGNATAVWGAESGLCAREFSAAAGTWSTTQLVAPAVEPMFMPFIGMVGRAADGDALLVFMQVTPDPQTGGISFEWRSSTYSAASASWSQSTLLPIQNLANFPKFDAQGNALLVANIEGEQPGLSLALYDAASGTWSSPKTVALTAEQWQGMEQEPAFEFRGDSACVAWLDVQTGYLNTITVTDGGPAVLTQQQVPTGSSAYPTGISVAPDGSVDLTWTRDELVEGELVFTRTHQRFQPAAASYSVPAGSTWQSLANTLYGVNSAAAGAALQLAMGNPALSTGLQLTGLPATLSVQSSTVVTVPAYYTVQEGDTWASIANAIYGTTDPDAIAALQQQLGNPPLTAGAELTVPLTLSYGAQGGAITTVDIADSAGVVTRYEQDEEGRLIAVTTATGTLALRTEYEYDADGNVLNIVRDPGGLNRVTTMTYDERGNLLSQRDDLGNTLERTYDTNNQLLTETQYVVPDADGPGAGQPSQPLTTRYVYDSRSNLRFVISADGRVVEHQYHSGNGQRLATFEYAAATYSATAFAESDLTSWAAAQNLTQLERTDYAYDGRGNLSTLTKYTATTSAGGGSGTPSVTRFVYDQRGLLLQTIDPRGEATTDDATDYVTTYTYDGLGRVLSTTVWSSASSQSTQLSSYDDVNRRTTITLANGLVTTQTYNRAGELISVSNGADGALGETLYTYDADGRLRYVTDPTGARQFYLYDAAGRKVAEVDGDGTLTEYIYNSSSQIVKTVQYAETLSSDTLTALAATSNTPALPDLRAEAGTNASQDRISRRAYDAAGRLIYTIDESGAVTEYTYDGAGRVLEELQYATLSSISTSLDELPSTITFTASTQDRRTRHFYDNDGQRLATLDGAGYLVAYVYDPAGRLTQQIGYTHPAAAELWAEGTLPQLQLSTSDPDRDVVSRFFHDGQGRTIGVLDAEGYLTETVYDLAGNVLQTARYDRRLAFTSGDTFQSLKQRATAAPAPTIRTTSYQYDGQGRLERQTNHEGTVTTYTYDSVGKLVGTTRAAGTTEARTDEVRYDFLGRVTRELTAEGRALITAEMTEAQIVEIWDRYSVAYEYDLAGRKISATVRPNDTQTNTTLYFYDADGHLRFEVNALGERTEYRYNALNQVEQKIGYVNRISTAGLSGGLLTSTLITTLTANADSARDAQTAYEYSLTGRVTSERVSRTTNTADDAVTTILYNAFGERIAQIQQIDATSALRVDYIYDHRGLVTETRSDASSINTVESRTYDAFGRVTTTIDARGNTWQTTYDRLGRAVTSTDPGLPARSMTYDAFDQVLTRTDALGNTTTYAYDSDQRRVTVTSPEGIVTSSVHNRHGETITVVDGRGTPTSYTYDANGQLKSTTTAAGTTTENYDRAGRRIETIDANNVSTVYTYDAANRVLTRSVDPTGLNLTSKTFHDGLGQAVWQQDANGVWTHLQYNRDGELVSVIVDPLSVPSSTSTQTSTTLVSNPTGLNLRTDYTYDLRGKTLTVTEGVGSAQPKVTRFIYDTLGRRIEEAVDPSGLNLRTTYTYDRNDNVVARTDARGDVTRFVYNVRNELIYSVDGTGAVVMTEYDNEGRVIKSTAYANRISFTSPATLPLVISSDDIVARLQANAAADQVTRTVYNRDGQVRYRIDAMGAVTKLTYDAAGNVVETTRYYTRITVPAVVNETTVAAAITVNSTYDQTERTVYDNANRAIFEIDAEGYVTQFAYDAEGRVTKESQYTNALAGAFTTNVAPQIVTTAPGSGSYVIRNAASDRVLRTVYDAAGRARFGVDGEGYITEFRYDGLGQQTHKIQYGAQYTVSDNATVANVTAQVPATPGAAEPVEQSIYDAAGRLSRTIDAEGVITLHVYDAVGRETDTTVAYGTADASTTHRVFNAAGYLIEETQGYGTAEASITRYFVDGVGNRIHTIDPRGYELAETDSAWAQAMRQSLGYPTTASALTTAQRSALRALYATAQLFDANGNITTVRDPAGRTIATEYDAFGNAVKVTDQRGNSGYFYFDKNNKQVLQVDPEGYVTQTVYNAFGTVDRVVHYGNKVVGEVATNSAPAIVTTTPNPVTGPYLLIDSARDQTTIIEHDRRGLQTRIVDAENNDEVMTYDAFGNKATYRDKLDSVFIYTFYRTGKVRTQTSPSVTVTTVNSAGTVDSSSQALVTEYTYDQRGNITRIREALGLPQQRDTTIQYDRLNREVRRNLPEIEVFGLGRQIPYIATTYDRRGNIVEVRNAAGGRTVSYYDALNRKVAEVDATGALAEFSYDDAGNLTRERAFTTRLDVANVAWTTRSVAMAGDTYREMEYEYDANNRQVRSLTQAETYFDTDRLGTRADGNTEVTTNGYRYGQIANRTYYDATGNVVMTVDGREHATLFFYNRLGQQILSVDALGYVTRFEYDGNGNVTRQSRYETQLSPGTISQLSPASLPADIINEVVTAQGQDRIVEIEYDRLGRKKIERTLSVRYNAVTDSGVLNSYDGAIQTGFEYDAAGNLTQVIKADGSQTNFVYDELGRLEQQIDPSVAVYNGMSGSTVLTTSWRATTEWQYDAFGNRTLQTRLGRTPAENQVTRVHYDEQGNVRSEWDAMNYRIDYEVDTAGRARRRVKTALDASGASHTYLTEFDYDALDRESSRRVVTDGVNGDLTWTTYNAFGDISARGINNTTQAEYRYDKLGHVLWTNADTGTPRAYVYDAAGNAVIEVSQSNGTDLSPVTTPGEVQGIAPELVQYRFSIYNARNQITDVFQAPMDFTGLTGSLSAEELEQLGTRTTFPTVVGTPVADPNSPHNSNPPATTITSGTTRTVTGTPTYNWYPSTPGDIRSNPTYRHPGFVSESEFWHAPVSTESNPPARSWTWDGTTMRVTTQTSTVIPGQPSAGSPQTTSSQTVFDYVTGEAVTPRETTTETGTPNVVVNSVDVRDYEASVVTAVHYERLGAGIQSQINFIPSQTITVSQSSLPDQGGGRRYYNAVRVPAIAGFSEVATQVTIIDGLGFPVVNQSVTGEFVTSLTAYSPSTTWRLIVTKGSLTLFDGTIHGNANYATQSAVAVVGQGVNAGGSVAAVQLSLDGGSPISLTPNDSIPGGRRWVALGIGAASSWQYKLYSSTAPSDGSLLAGVAGSVANPSSNLTYLHSVRQDTEYYWTERSDPQATAYNRLDVTKVVQQSNYVLQLLYSIASGNTLSNQIHRQSQYNAFGEVTGEIDGRGYLTEYQYNELGQVIRKVDPIVAETDEHGVRNDNFRPETQYYVDALGQTIGTTDANGFTTKVAIRNGHLTAQFNPDGNVERHYFDVFGNEVASTAAEINLTTRYQYDQNNRLVRTDFAGGNYDAYGYDSLGNRIEHTNGIGSVERYYYDAEGRITLYRSGQNRETTYSYTFLSTIGERGGYRKLTTDAMGNQQIDDVDMYGKIRSHTDLGGRVYTYDYNSAGWLTSQQSTVSATDSTQLQNIQYFYYANGYVKEIRDLGINSTALFEYDKDGNRTLESYSVQSVVPGEVAYGQTPYQMSTATYDGLNRVTAIAEDGRYKIEYEYDKVGNRRRVRSEYYDLLKPATSDNLLVQDYWYEYDSMNRFTTTMGQLTSVGGEIVRGAYGYDITYNGANQRTSQKTTDNAGLTIKETYSYDNNGFLTITRINPDAERVTGDGAKRAERVNNAVGDRTGYFEYNSAEEVTSHHTYEYDADHMMRFDRDIANSRGVEYILLADGRVDRSVTYNADPDAAVVTQQYHYENWDSYKQSAIEISGAGNNVNGEWQDGRSDFDYDVNGHLDSVYDHAANRTIWYVNNHNGQTLKRLQWLGHDTSIRPEAMRRFYYLYGKAVGDQAVDGSKAALRIDYAQELRGTELEGNGNKQYLESRRYDSMPQQWQQWSLHYTQDGRAQPFQHKDIGERVIPVTSADFDQNFQPINENYPPPTAGTYIVVAGDTLRTIAASVWGDSSLWYLIAEANGLSDDVTLVPDMRLTIPNVVSNIHNNATTFRPVDPGLALGDTSPTLPQPPPPPAAKKGCGVLGMILVIVVAIVVTVFTAGVGTAAAGSGLTGIMSAGVTTLGAGFSTTALVAGAIGAAASQGVAMALGMQKDFDWTGVATGAIGAAVGAGIGKLASNVSSLSWLNNTTGLSGFGAQAVRGAIGQAATQGVSMALGLQKQFSWTQVAASAAGAGVGNAMGNWLSKAVPDSAGLFAKQFATGFGSSAASAGVYEAITGKQANYGLIAAQSFGTALGNSLTAHIVQKGLDASTERVLQQAGVAGHAGDTQQSRLAIRAMLQAGGSEADVAKIVARDDWRSAFLKLDDFTAGGITAEQAADRVLEFEPNGQVSEPTLPAQSQAPTATGVIEEVTSTARRASSSESIFGNAIGGSYELLDAFGTLHSEHPALATLGYAGVSAVLGGPTKTFLKRLAGNAGDTAIERGAEAFGSVVGRAATNIATKNKWTIGLSIAGYSGEADANVIGTAAGTVGSIGVETVFGAGVGQVADRIRDLRKEVIPRINGKRPRNHAYAGSVMPGSVLPKNLREKYPEGVAFNVRGFPDFSRHRIARTEPFRFTTRNADFAHADAMLGRPRPDGYTWHHHQDGFLELVPTDLHDFVKHTGGVAVQGSK